MLHTKYQGSRSGDFRQDDFYGFSYINLCKYVTPEADPFLTPGTSFE